MSNNFVTSFCTTGIAGYRRGHKLHEKFTLNTANNVTDGDTPNSVSHSCTTSFDFTLNIFCNKYQWRTEGKNIGLMDTLQYHNKVRAYTIIITIGLLYIHLLFTTNGRRYRLATVQT